MSSLILNFTCAAGDFDIETTGEFAPHTLQAVIDSLPQKLPLHCAKIAGSHIYWPTPVVERLETRTDIHSLQPGAFLYWPDRQYLELVYSELQYESATVNVLGRLKGDVGWLATFAEKQRRLSGVKLFTAQLDIKDRVEPAGNFEHFSQDPWGKLRSATRSAWKSKPAEVSALMDRDGLNMPFGPLITAESSFRNLHEVLWRLWNDTTNYQPAEKKMVAILSTELAIDRIGGFTQMHQACDVLGHGLNCLTSDHLNQQNVLKELIRYCGRMTAWLDLEIPWWLANEQTKLIRDAAQIESHC